MQKDTTVKLLSDKCEACVRSVGFISVGGNLSIAFIKVFLGLIGGSHALFADGIHSFADAGCSVAMVISLRITKKPHDTQYPYGYHKVEFITAAAMYGVLFVVGIAIFISGVHHILHHVRVCPDLVTIIGGLISLVVNEMIARQCFCCGHLVNSPSMIANAHECRSDAWASAAVLAGIIGARLGWSCLDPFAAILVSILIFELCIKHLIRCGKGLLDHSLGSQEIGLITSEIFKYPGFKVRRMRTRELGQEVAVEIDLEVDRNSQLKDLEVVRSKLKKSILQSLGRLGEVTIYFTPQRGSSQLT